MVLMLSSLYFKDATERLSPPALPSQLPPSLPASHSSFRRALLFLPLSKGTSTAVSLWPDCSNGIPRVPCSRPEKSQPFGPPASNSWYLVKLLSLPQPPSAPLLLSSCSRSLLSPHTSLKQLDHLPTSIDFCFPISRLDGRKRLKTVCQFEVE